MSDPRARDAAIRYMAVLQAITAMGMLGFGKMLDTATKEQMTDHLEAVSFLESEITRLKGLR